MAQRHRTRMYFVNGTDTAYEWNGSVLTPIHTGISGAGVERRRPLGR